MDIFNREFIYLDGMWLKEGQLLKLAFNADRYDLAEHYLFAYLTHAVVFGKQEALKKVNEVRKAHGLNPFPYLEEECGNGARRRKQNSAAADLARTKYLKMTSEQRIEVLVEAMTNIMTQNLKLFQSSACWCGIYLVIKDRLDGSLKKSKFAELGILITPEGWPQSLAIATSTLTNISHYVNPHDRKEAYYDMKNCPWEDLCKTFWEILEQGIITKS